MLTDLYEVWPDDETFVPTRELVSKLILHSPDYWGTGSRYGKPLTETRLGRLMTQGQGTSSRPDTHGPRGYLRSQLQPVWRRLGIAPKQPGEPGEPGEPGAEQPPVSGLSGFSQLIRVQTDPYPTR